ncbi:hypothetical protein G6F38_001467 [Rhizopus arrhizus]|nr:hypothetical protein G6F38_001467 [Rhizopus arrhizus]
MASLIRENEVNSEQDRCNDAFRTNNPILPSPCNETIDYPTLNCLSNEMIDSLQSVKHISLKVLDILLKQMTSYNTTQRRSHSSFDLIQSITQSTSLLSGSSVARSFSSPSNIGDVHKVLESYSFNSDKDYTLCCTIAALLNNIYQLLELNDISSSQQKEYTQVGEQTKISSLQQQLWEQLSLFQNKKKGLNQTVASQEMLVIWQEIDHLSDVVYGMIIQQDPPAYESRICPPKYDDTHTSILIESSKDELDDLLGAIYQLSCVAPRLNNQRAYLPPKKSNEERLLESLERLQSRRMDNQRSCLKNQKDMLQHLIQQIQTSASRSFDNQRVHLKNHKAREIHFIVHRMQRCRYTNQDAMSYEERLVNDLKHTTDLLVKSLYRPAYIRQRSELRIRRNDEELKVDKDLEQIFSFIHKATKHQLNNQRASFTL